MAIGEGEIVKVEGEGVFNVVEGSGGGVLLGKLWQPIEMFQISEC